MSPALTPGALVAAAEIALPREPVPADQVVEGAPSTGYAVLDAGGPELGVWEMTPGSMRDVEADEVFIVLHGDATVRFVTAPGMPEPPPSIDLAPGCVVRLSAGMETVWTVRETLRKVYVA